MVLTLSWEQGKICPASVAWWPWPKVTETGTKIFSHTLRLTMCGLKKLASRVFLESWKVLAEGRCMAAAAETDQKQLEQLEHTHTPAPWLPILMIHIRSHVKTRQSYKFLKTTKNLKFEILHETLHATHLLMLLHKMYKYEMNPTRTVGATEQTRDAGQTDGRTDGWTDGHMEWNQYTPQQLRCARV